MDLVHPEPAPTGWELDAGLSFKPISNTRRGRNHRPASAQRRRPARRFHPLRDWDTSKTYVIGLAFAVAGYASFWLVAAMSVLTALVGLNYIIICRLYPDGGGVYASARHRSEIISIVGGFLLIADDLVTAAINALSAFQYLGVPHPERFAAALEIVLGGAADLERAGRGTALFWERNRFLSG